MRTRVVVIAAVVGLLLLVGAGAVYAYDHAHAEQIGKGVRVGGVDVSELTPEQARAKLRTAVLDPLSRPVVVRARGKRYTLTPERAKVAVDIDGSVARRAGALARRAASSSRTWRGLRGESLDAERRARHRTTPSARSARLVERVGKAVDEPAVDASVDLEHGDVTPQAVRRRAAGCWRASSSASCASGCSTSATPRRCGREIEVVKPKVTTDELAEKYPAIVFVNRSGFQLTLYKDLKLAKTYGIAVGQVGLETPAGLYHIQNKAVNPAWTMPNSDWVAPADRGKVVPGGTPENPLKARWLGIYAGAGIHGTDATSSIGSAASHGCIRMLIPDVIELYDQVPVGAPIYIS